MKKFIWIKDNKIDRMKPELCFNEGETLLAALNDYFFKFIKDEPLKSIKNIEYRFKCSIIPINANTKVSNGNYNEEKLLDLLMDLLKSDIKGE